MTNATHLTWPKRFLFSIVAFSSSCCLALLLLESGARWIEARQQNRRAVEYLSLFTENPMGTGSYRLRPDLDLNMELEGRSIRIRTNSHGMAWRGVSVEKGARRRVAFLGDSFTFGAWADSFEKSFVGVFDSSVSSERWEVLNFGVGGYGLADVELQLREQVMDFSPTYVIVVVFTGNDFRDTFLGIDKDRIVDGTAVLDDANVRARVPGELLVEDTTVATPCEREPYLLRRLDSSSAFRLLAPFVSLENLCIDFAVNRNFTMYTFWSQYPYPDAAVAAKDAVLETLKRMDHFLKQHRARLAVAAIPMSEQVHARKTQGPNYDIAYPQVYIQSFARERGIPYLDLLPILREHVIRTNERLYWKHDPHLNNRGHEVVGEALADWFRCCIRNVRPRQFETLSSTLSKRKRSTAR